jgi:SAM-dependent methyltransferase
MQTIENPYLEECERENIGYASLLEYVERLRFDRPYRDLRGELTKKYAWAIPTAAAIARLVEWSPVVEIGCGTGYWASLVQAAGGNVLAFDAFPPPHRANGYHVGARPYTKVREGDERMAEVHPNRTLLLCWPPYNEPMAAQALRLYRRAGGRRVIYVGEGFHGCTGNTQFHKQLGRDWREVEEIALAQWPGIHDSMWCYERRAR